MPDKTLKVGTLYRSATIRKEHVDEEKRTVDLTFSSEFPVDRFFGREILDHTPGAADLDRLNDAGPLLVDHNREDHVGVIEFAKIGSDRRGHAVARFGQSARAEEIFRDVADQIRNHVSIGYRIHEVILEKSDDGGETYRVTQWEGLEISVTSVPADPSVGMGRAQPDDDIREIPIIQERGQAMPNKDKPAAAPAITAAASRAAAAPSYTPAATPAVAPSDTPAATPAVAPQPRSADTVLADERTRASEILAVGRRFNLETEAADAIRDGVPLDEFNRRALERLGEGASAQPLDLRGGEAESPEIGLSPDEARRFSFVRAIQAALSGDWSAAGFEREVSLAAIKKLNISQRGDFVIPYDVLVATRDLTVGTDTAGGFLKGTDHLAGSFIDLLRNRMMVQQLGAFVLDGLVGDIAIPALTGGAAGSWTAEGAAASESNQTFGQVAMSPKTVTAFTDLSRKLILQSTPAVENLIRSDLASALALAIDVGAINGSGVSNQPTGILNTTGIGDVAGGTNGLAPTWAHVVELETDVSVANADVGTIAYLTNSKVRGKLKTTEKASSTGIYIWGDGAANDPGFGSMNGYRAAVSNQVPSNLTKGSGTNLSATIFGNWADLMIGMWGALDVLVDPYTGGTAGTVRIINHQDVDIAIRHAASFSAHQDIITT